MFGLIESLMGIMIYVTIGIVIGWHFPQPKWAEIVLAWMKRKAIAAWEWLKRQINNNE